ncbi:MAG: 1-acyl-sn-glycerol-3-phosphate acyltransferase [Muribaculaceae bacterium]|nr:1-acyl-sn-glycerol-3-phosphate acyltransferase [Muribaculaceae bacterium]
MNLAARILKLAGWKVEVSVPDFPKAIICVAPHTSNWDFILGELAIRSVGRKAGFMMKSSWFFFPLGYFFRAIGGIPVVRERKTQSLVEAMVARFKSEPRLVVAITPEGTRKPTANWHTGFLRIAGEADIPICLAVIDFRMKKAMINDVFIPTGNVDADLAEIKKYYRPFTGRHPDNFITD